MKWACGVVGLLVVSVALLVSGCGDGGSGGGGPAFYFKAMDLTYAGKSKGGVGEAGSEMPGMEALITKIELKNSGGTYVTAYTGDTYVKTVGTGAGTIAGALQGALPPNDTYTGFRMTMEGIRIKLKIVDSSTTYYTPGQTITHGDVWPMSTSAADYDFLTIAWAAPETMGIDFATPMTVDGTADANLVWVLERNGIVYWEGADIDNITWAGEQALVLTFTPGEPAMWMRFALEAEDATAAPLENTITLLLDASENLLGGYCHRPTNRAVNGDWMVSGSLSNVANGGYTAEFTASFADGDNALTGWVTIDGSYDCPGGTGTYTLTGVTPVNSMVWYAPGTVVLSGTAECYP